MNLDWSDLRTWDGSQNRAFELLCDQLAAAEAVPAGSTFVAKAAPDAGVECYWCLPNGDEWAWQAKFFRDPPGDAQWKQMDESVEVALRKHPRLTRHTFCLPRDREDPRIASQEWFMDRWNARVDRWRQLAEEQGTDVEFLYWGEFEILDRLSHDTHAGRLYFWFNRECLHQQWFEDRIQTVKANAGPRYSPELNVELPISKVFDGLGRSLDFVPQNLKTVCRQLSTAWKNADRPVCRESVEPSFFTLQKSVQEIIALIDKIPETGVLPLPFSQLKELAAASVRLASECIDELDRAAAAAQEEKRGRLAEKGTMAIGPSKSESIRFGAYYLNQVAGVLSGLLSFTEGAEGRLANLPALLLVGDAGAGKTHLFCDVADRRVRSGFPAVVLLGEQFNDEEPWTQIIKILGLSCSRKEELLGSLEASAQCTGSRALILIDALNEGEGRSLWHKHLAGMLSTLAGYPWIGIALSVRTSYEHIVVPEQLVQQERLVRCEHDGFSEVEYDATHKFFEYYSIQSPTVPFMTPEFWNPQFLKLFCMAIHGRGLTTIPAGLGGITPLIDFFLSSIEDRLCRPEHLDYDPSSRLVYKAIDRLAERLADTGKTWVPRDEARSLVDEFLPSRGWDRSLFGGMLSEGLIAADLYFVGRDEPPVEGIRFSYERLTDHLVTGHLLEKHLDSENPLSSFASGQFLGDIVADENAAWRNRGLVEALSIQLPERTGKELFELAPRCSGFRPVEEAFLESLVWRKPSTIRQPAIDYIDSSIIRTEQGYYALLNTLITVGPRREHPLNARFLHGNLKAASLPHRDATWSIYLHWQYGSHGIVDRMIYWAWSAADKRYAEDEAVFLTSLVLGWFLTSSNRFVRDRSTKAIIALLEGRLNVLEAFIREFVDVNDSYVLERIFAAAYGCVMRSADTEGIGRVAQTTYDLVFKEGNPPVDVLTRDYARGVIEVALLHRCHVEVSADRVRPPYRSDWPDDIPSEAELKQNYYPKDISKDPGYSSIWFSVMSHLGDFSRYIIGTNSGSFEWTSRRIGKEYGPTKKQLYERFKASLTRKQEEAFSAYEAVRHTNEFFVRFDDKGRAEIFRREYSEEEWAALREKALQRLEKTLGKSKLRAFVSAAMSYLEDPKDETAFDLSMAERWIFKRVVDLGWTPELFGEFDRNINYNDMRGTRKPERIGKKYQWIAYHEFLARVSDNFTWVGRWDDDPAYEGPWQLLVRDIDPSVLLQSTGYRPYEEFPSWWFPVSYDHWDDTADPVTWLQTNGDLPDPKTLIDLRHPDNAQEWLMLSGLLKWEQPVPAGEDKYETARKEIWYSISASIVRKEEEDEIFRWARTQNLERHSTPLGPDLHNTYLGEYPWARSVPSREDWDPGEQSGFPRPVVASSSRYVWSSGYDCSIDDTMSIAVPCRWLVQEMDLRWKWPDSVFVDDEGRVVAFDPSVHDKGESVLLFNKALFSDFLDRNGYAVVWTLVGEKQILGPSTGPREYNGRLEISGACRLDKGALELHLNPVFHGPEL